MGDATSHSILLATSGMDEEVLLEALRRLREAALLAETTDGSDVAYSITHPLIQEAVYSEMPEMARRRAHVLAIEAIESFSVGRPDDTSRLARHYRGAGAAAMGERAVITLIAAGERALAQYANQEAVRHYEAALAIVHEGNLEAGSSGSEESSLPRLLERLGEARERMGEQKGAIEVWTKALTEREKCGDAVAIARLNGRLAVAELNRGQFSIANAHLEAGLAVLADREPCQELADLLYTRLQTLSQIGDVSGVAGTAVELLTVAQRLASPRAEAEANLAASTSCLWQNDASGALERALHALRISEQAQDLMTCCRAHYVLSMTHMRLGAHEGMHEHAERGLAIAWRLGAPAFEVVLRSCLAQASFMAGSWDEAMRCSTVATALSRRLGDHRNLAFSLAERAIVLAFRGDLSDAEVCLTEVRTVFGAGRPVDRYVFDLVDIAEVAVALERGQTERALAVARVIAGSSLLLVAAPAGLTPAYTPMGLTLLAEAQVAAGEAESALETAGRLLGLGPSDTPYLTALASRVEGLARQASGEVAVAAACLDRAHETFTALAMPFEAARSLLEWATCVMEPQAQVAVRAAQQSLATFERLGAQRYANRARRLLRGWNISPLATSRPRLGGAFVSSRELDVARLVAQGLTTAEVAKRMTISPLTVTRHLQRMYARLSINSRTALARLVIEAGLISSPNDVG